MFKILLPTDFSDNAWNAISYAMEFFKNEQATFYLLHTYTPAFYRMDYMMGGPSFSAIPDVGVDISLAGLENTLEQVNKTFNNPNHTVKTISAFNLLTDEINEVSEEKDIDLIVMGTQGATGAKEIFLGSNTVFVLRKAIVPVLAIPESYSYQKIEKMLFPTDYQIFYKPEEIDTIKGFAAIHGAEITVLHVKEEYDLNETQVANKQHLEKCLAGVSHRFEEKKGAIMPDAVIDYINDHNYQLLTMMNRKHSFMERLLWKQNIDQIGFHTPVPFLVIRDTASDIR
ncbi:universal stress protein [Lentiprolixibacter aurantiacus]|uniref:Universal stress protein n=1 Tax=Lentiprolixibacter aurantiacus TaxID=2993939 RepID=A0AAE3MNM3_9FLAO|nr:universal stress protein [Lentiprolixibacter aurantiacus]MCX2720753.1 universal stress protein [Lentiprolixibacter aurantiacus]